MKHPLKTAILTGLLGVTLGGFALPVRADVTVPFEAVVEKAKNQVLETLKADDPSASYQVTIANQLAPIRLKGETLEIHIDDRRPTPRSTRGIVNVTLTTESDTRRLGLPVRVTVEKPVWVATAPIAAGEALSAKNARLQTKIMETEAPYSIDAKQAITKYKSRINVNAGSILDSRNLAAIPAVHQNDDIQLILQMPNGVKLSIYARALENGSIGQRIRVSRKLPDQKTRVYTGEVVASNTVLVRL